MQKAERLVTCAVATVLLGGVAVAQVERPTIPELLLRAGKSLSGLTTIPSGIPPTVSEILADTDMIVTGVIGEPRSYLSKDQKEVYTEYPIRKPVVLFQTESYAAAPAATVTLLGGAVTVNGLTFTSDVPALPRLPPGTECVLLLKRSGDEYRIAGEFYGAFRVVNGRIRPLTGKQGFAPEYRDAPAPQAIEDIVARARSARE